MKFDPQKYHRRSIRLQNYDYTQAGAYFITICAHQRECLFGEIIDGEMVLNEYGKVVEEYWNETPIHFPNVEMDAFVVMPNHIHGIIVIAQSAGTQSTGTARVGAGVGAHVGAQHAAPLRAHQQKNVASGSLGTIVRSFKSAVTRQLNQMRSTPSAAVWQRNYYEHVIRDDDALKRIRDYIVANPFRWKDDENNPQRHDQVWDEWGGNLGRE